MWLVKWFRRTIGKGLLSLSMSTQCREYQTSSCSLNHKYITVAVEEYIVSEIILLDTIGMRSTDPFPFDNIDRLSLVTPCRLLIENEKSVCHDDDRIPWNCSLLWTRKYRIHYSDVIMSAMAYQITSLSIVYSTVCSAVDQRKHQRSASLAFVRGIHRWPMDSPHKGPVTRKYLPLITSSYVDPLGMGKYRPHTQTKPSYFHGDTRATAVQVYITSTGIVMRLLLSQWINPKWFWCTHHPESKVHEANMGSIWGQLDLAKPHVGPMNFAIWTYVHKNRNVTRTTVSILSGFYAICCHNYESGHL